MYYQTLLKKLAPDLNPAGVEASMRLHYGTLNHLPREIFVEEMGHYGRPAPEGISDDPTELAAAARVHHPAP